ncbi:hypothetical protein FA15DRAFT_666863 [Coprinopsis marcescibilis]|uniref:Nephrocystin 3-like N-terminal domain-containing protein n=1 Tax=Coprinopsis marcescibilis TaxID=230819 RepID=A0A5C3L276_COPMA|nr:hypothetical protein FA15DRAFT_666863 [Coprinopsis marcescibilis]
MFQGAQHFELREAQLTAVGRDNNTTNNYFGLAGLDAAIDPMDSLHRHFAIEATHDSETAAYAPRCKPGTRVTVLTDIMGWVGSKPSISNSASIRPSALLWLSGPAGGGKTCIQREVVTRCQEQGILAASYFFSSRLKGLDGSRQFVSTIALQLCTAFPGIQPFIEDEIQDDPMLFEKSLEYQFERLVSRPLDRLTNPPEELQMAKPPMARPPIESPEMVAEGGCLSVLWGWALPARREVEPVKPVIPLPAVLPHKVIVVDGLDECKNPRERVRLIRLLAAALIKYSIPLKIAIASRPEYEIRSTFDDPSIAAITHRIKLEEYGCDTDIEDYLVDSLFDIRRKHPSASAIPAEWPSREDVKKLVEKASGQFVYASTFLKFVDNPRRDLVEMFTLALNFHLALPSGPINPFHELDLLYKFILESADVDATVLKPLLHGLAFLGGQFENTQQLDEFFRFKPGTSALALCDLHAIVHIPNRSTAKTIRFYHKSLEDYLSAPSRSGTFHQPLLDTRKHMLELCTYHLRTWRVSSPTRNLAHTREVPKCLQLAQLWVELTLQLLENDIHMDLLISPHFAQLPSEDLRCCLNVNYMSRADTLAGAGTHLERKRSLQSSVHLHMVRSAPLHYLA